MGITLNQQEDRSLITLGGNIDISLAAELKMLLLDAMASGQAIYVKLEKNVMLDVTAVQLLWAGARQTKASCLEFTVASPAPDALSASLAEVGFETMPFPMLQEN
jgi:anti-anti-sigma regulatory factor